MVKHSIFLFMLLFVSSLANAQRETGYYKETRTFYEDGYTYQCDVQKYFVTLYNKENKHTDFNIRYKKTGQLLEDNPRYGENPLVEDLAMENKAKSIVNKAFSEKEAELLKRDLLTVTLFISPDNGSVLEVFFNFPNIFGITHIPVNRFREIELSLKEELHFTPTSLGRELDVIGLMWSQTPTGRK